MTAVALTISGNTQVSGTTVGSTNMSPAGAASPSCSESARLTNPDVVYRVSVTVPTRVRVSGRNGFTPVLYVRAFDNCSNHSLEGERACSSGSSGSTEVDLPLTDQPYALIVDGNTNSMATQQSGAFDLIFSVLTPPANDRCMGSRNLGMLDVNGAKTEATVDTSQAVDDDTPSCGWSGRARPPPSGDVFFDFTTTAAADLYASVEADFEARLSIRPRTGCQMSSNDLRCATLGGPFSTNTTVVNAASAATYTVVVEGANGSRGPIRLRLWATPVPTTAPSNDGCAMAVPLALNAQVRGSTRAATNATTANLPLCSVPAQMMGRDVFFSVPATAPTTVIAAYDDPAVEMVMASGEICDLSTQTVCVAPMSGGVPRSQQLASLEVPQASGDARVLVDASGATGSSFSIRARPRLPANTNCAMAQVLELTTLSADRSVVDSLSGAQATLTPSTLGGPCFAAVPNGEMYYRFTPTQTRAYTATVEPQAGLNTALLLFPGSCMPSACSQASTEGIFDGVPDRLTFNGTAGTTYYIAVVGSLGSSQLRGAFRLKIE
jgi:large repetitive protein